MSTTTAPWGALRKFNGTALTHARKWLTVLSAVLMLTGSFLISGCGGVHENHADDLHIAVIDAGSSGSRIVLYERLNQGDSLQVEQRFADSGGLALSSFESNPAEAGPLGVKPLLDNLLASLQANSISPGSVKVHLLATAGMRLLEAHNPAAAAAIYDSARATMARSGLRLGRVETLSGIDEGLFAWLDLNELAGNFNADRTATLGLLEIGGASTQIAFVTRAQDSRAVSVSVKGKSYRVLSLSWLGLGQDQARLSMIGLTQTAAGQTDNVCYPDNTSQVGGLRAFDAGINGLLIDSGSYDFSACSALYNALLRGMQVREVTTVSDFAATTLVGVSAVKFALSDWRATSDPAMLGRQLQDSCTGLDAYGKQVLPLLVRSAPGNYFAQNACANGTYVQALVFGPEGLGLRSDQLRVDIGKDQSVNWTRGVALAGS
jgi:GDA1/CD39 (nucleoside phosphatase) family